MRFVVWRLSRFLLFGLLLLGAGWFLVQVSPFAFDYLVMAVKFVIELLLGLVGILAMLSGLFLVIVVVLLPVAMLWDWVVKSCELSEKYLSGVSFAFGDGLAHASYKKGRWLIRAFSVVGQKSVEEQFILAVRKWLGQVWAWIKNPKIELRW